QGRCASEPLAKTVAADVSECAAMRQVAARRSSPTQGEGMDLQLRLRHRFLATLRLAGASRCASTLAGASTSAGRVAAARWGIVSRTSWFDKLTMRSFL